MAKKCKSTTYPCRAGERCPDHNFLVSLPSTKERFQSLIDAKLPSTVPLLKPVDKHYDEAVNFMEMVTQTHPGVEVYAQKEKIAYTIKRFKTKEPLSVEQEVSILCTLVSRTPHEVYSYASKAKFSPAAYLAAGFEPNPYYWADKNPETAPEAVLEHVNRNWSRVNKTVPQNPGNPLHQMKKLRKYPYIKLKAGIRFSDYVNLHDGSSLDAFKDIKKAEQQRVKAVAAASEKGVFSLNFLG